MVASKLEKNLYLLANGTRPQFILQNGRQPQFLGKGEDDLNN